jgi:release factor glutamine methyltransferase
VSAGGSVGAALGAAQRLLGAVEARALLASALARDAAWLIAHADQPLDAAAAARYAELIRRRAAGEPVAYLTGEREFYGLPFRVTPAVLIPRPETELLVELALARLAPGSRARVLDLGTGSGCVALSIARARPAVRVLAVDCSSDALAVAAANARALGAANVELRRGDWFEGLAGERFELIVANPPYVADGDPHLACGDLRHEPRAALAAGADGLAAIRAIVAAAPGHLAAGGALYIEHGHDQGARCRALLAGAGFAAVGTHCDLAGLDRVSGGVRD